MSCKRIFKKSHKVESFNFNNDYSICFIDEKLVTEDNNILNNMDYYLENNFEITISIEPYFRDRKTYLSSFKNINGLFQPCYDVLIADDFNLYVCEANLKDCSTNAILLKVYNNNFIESIRILIQNPKKDNLYIYNMKYTDYEMIKTLGILAKNDIGWKFYPCQKIFV